MLFFLDAEGLFTLGQFNGIEIVMNLVLSFIGLYLALWVQEKADEKKEQGQYLDNLKSFHKEISKNTEISVCENLQEIRKYNEDFENLCVFLDDISYYFDDDSVVNNIEPALTNTKDALACYDEEQQKKLFSLISETKPLPVSPTFKKDIYRVYLMTGVAVAQKFEKDEDLSSELGRVYNSLEVIERRVRDIEDVFNNVYMPKYSEITYDGVWLLDKIRPLLDGKAADVLTEDDRQEIRDIAKGLQEMLLERGEVYSIISSKEHLINSAIQQEEEIIKDLEENIQPAIEQELAAFGQSVEKK